MSQVNISVSLIFFRYVSISKEYEFPRDSVGFVV